MASSIYVTFDRISLDSGAGKVCYHEIAALKQATELKRVISVNEIPQQVLRHYGFNPFLCDYFVAHHLISGNDEKIDLAHLSCSPAIALLNSIKPEASVVNVVAHDLKLSIEEHERITGASYPFVHNTDPYLHMALLRHAEKADVILTPSQASAQWIKENVNAKRIEVIPHGTDIPTEPSAIPDEFRVGYLGVWGPDKGLIYLLMAWQQLNYHDGSAMVFAGTCGRTLKGILPKFREKTGENYITYGKIPEISEFFNQICIYVQPSVTEGWGLPVGEAMGHGKPVIVSEGAGSADMVEDGKEGFIVPIRDPKAISNKIQYFKDNPNQIKIMGERARAKAEKYSWANIEENYRILYEELAR